MNQQKNHNIEKHRQECIQIANINLIPWWGHLVGWIAVSGISVGLVIGKVLDWQWLSWHSALFCGIIIAEVLIAVVNLLIVVKWRGDDDWREKTNEALNRYMHISESPLTFASAREMAGVVTEDISKRISLRFTTMTISSMILCLFICLSFLFTVTRIGVDAIQLELFLLPAIFLSIMGAIVLMTNTASILLTSPVLRDFQNKFAHLRATDLEGTLRRDNAPAGWNRDTEDDTETEGATISDKQGAEVFGDDQKDANPVQRDEFSVNTQRTQSDQSLDQTDPKQEYNADKSESATDSKTAESGMWD